MIDNIILSTNEELDYLEYLPIVTRAWKNLLGDNIKIIVGAITKKRPTRNLEMQRDYTVYNFQCDNKVLSRNYAMTVRLYLASLFVGETSLLSDIDMLALNSNYFLDNAEKLIKNHIMFYTADAYGEINRYPICYILAQGSVYREIVNPENDKTFYKLFDRWRGIEIDESYDVDSPKFADESLLKYLLERWNHPERHIKLNRGWQNNIAKNRIDRANWKIDFTELNKGKYVDAHLLRPYSENTGQVRPLLEYLGII